MGGGKRGRVAYAVKEIYFTLQGEGYHTGRPAVFLRFTGCNLWTGREEDRATAVCNFCDTDFVGVNGPGGGKFATPEDLADAVLQEWDRNAAAHHDKFTVLTGGEPLLQLDAPLIAALHAADFEIAIETNGTLPTRDGVDWVCVSPKAGADFLQRSGDELKIVYPQNGLDPADFLDLDFTHFLLQPMDGPDVTRNTELAARYCDAHPQWKLSLQTHKILNLP
jgi:7-carboxy-7-deazaguanine synthase (Cx14CxxC type)